MTARSKRNRIGTALALTRAADTYWVKVHRCIQREQFRWQLGASAIPDSALRSLALQANVEKWGNIEGAGAFATFLRPARRAMTIRALVAFQVAFDYVDNVAEQPSSDRPANTRQLHTALLAALDPSAPSGNYYAKSTQEADNEYLQHLVDAAREALVTLPQWVLVAGHLRRAARRIIAYQSLNHTKNLHYTPATWGQPPGTTDAGMRWWELFAAGGSSLDVLALIAAAADPTLTQPDADALAGTYSPLVGAFHTLLDSLIDYDQDHTDAQRSLIDHYPSLAALAEGLQRLARQAADSLDDLPHSTQHRLLFTAMSCLYLSASEASAAPARLARERVMQELDWTAAPMLLMLRLRRVARIIRQLA